MGMQTSAGDFDGLQGARILLVDDDPFIRKVAARVLAELGASVTSACSGEEALECLTCGQFGCVLMDVQMPGLDGPQTTRLIRASTRLAHLPVIALSANASELDRQRCREAGMDDFIAKPLVRAQLESTLAGWLSAARPAGGDAAGAAVAAPKQWKAPAGDPEIIDLAILSRWVGGDAVRFRLYAQLFVDTGTATLAQLAVARTAADLRQLAALAPSLQGERLDGRRPRHRRPLRSHRGGGVRRRDRACARARGPDRRTFHRGFRRHRRGLRLR